MSLTDALQNKFRTDFARSLLSSFDPLSKDNYFVFFGKATAWSDETTPPTVADSVAEHFAALRNALFAIKVDERNCAFVVPRFDWTTGTVYDEYDDSVDLHDVGSLKKYYVLADGDRVYKCIDNNSGAESTEKPTSTNTYIFTTNDGYKWQFMYKLTEDQKEFLTDEYMPVSVAQKSDETIGQLQYEVQTKAVDGLIYKVDVTDNDAVYEYSIRNAIELQQDALTGTTGCILPDDNSDVSVDASAYVGYVLYVSGGQGAEIGQLRRITAYDTTTRELTLDSALSQTIFGRGNLNPSQVQIFPEILIHGDGSGAKAYVQVDADNKPSGVSIVDGGRGYKYAFTTFPTTRTSGNEPTGDVQIGPVGGHGSRIIDEFDTSRLMIRVLNENVENQVEIIDVNDFRQFGIIKNPVLNDNSQRVAGSEYDRKTSIDIRKPHGISAQEYFDTGSNPTFTVGESVYGFDSQAIAEIVSWRLNDDREGGKLILKNPSNDFVLPSTTDQNIRIHFGASGASGDYALYETVKQFNDVVGSTAEGVVKYWDSTARELVLRLSATGSFAAVPFSSGTTQPIRGESSNAEHSDYQKLEDEGGEIVGTFGLTSGTFNKLGNTTKIARISQGIDTFIETSETPVYKMTTTVVVEDSGGSLTSSSFTLDDGITQENDRIFSTANVASWTATNGNTGELVLTNVVGGFTSGATFASPDGAFDIDSVTEPDLVKGSGEVLYIQNIRPISRQKRQREEFRISIGF
jgi:hypothetical protein